MKLLSVHYTPKAEPVLTIRRTKPTRFNKTRDPESWIYSKTSGIWFNRDQESIAAGQTARDLDALLIIHTT